MSTTRHVAAFLAGRAPPTQRFRPEALGEALRRFVGSSGALKIAHRFARPSAIGA